MVVYIIRIIHRIIHSMAVPVDINTRIHCRMRARSVIHPHRLQLLLICNTCNSHCRRLTVQYVVPLEIAGTLRLLPIVLPHQPHRHHRLHRRSTLVHLPSHDQAHLSHTDTPMLIQVLKYTPMSIISHLWRNTWQHVYSNNNRSNSSRRVFSILVCQTTLLLTLMLPLPLPMQVIFQYLHQYHLLACNRHYID